MVWTCRKDRQRRKGRRNKIKKKPAKGWANEEVDGDKDMRTCGVGEGTVEEKDTGS